MTPVVPDDGPGLDPGRGPGTGNVRGIKEGTGQELEVGTTIERGNGMRGRGIQIGPIEVEATERVVRVETQELEVVTVPYWKGWRPDLLHPVRSNKQSSKRLKSQFMGKSSPRFPSHLHTLNESAWNLSDRAFFPFFSRFLPLSLSFLLSMQA